MERRYRAHWGFNANAEQMSYWSESESRMGGVAILLNPYLVASAEPAFREHWTENFMAVECMLDGHSVLVVNVYVPTLASEREAFYRGLAKIEIAHDGPMLLGGDFNCTQQWRMDRSYEANAASHCSKALDELLAAWDVVDALDSMLSEDLDEQSVLDFHRRHHTYHYKVHGRDESSRLDRWYLNDVAVPWFREVSQEILMGATSHVSDHAAVHLEISDPASRPRI